MSNEQTPTAGDFGSTVGLERKLALLAIAYQEDYGSALPDAVMSRVLRFCDGLAQPDSISAQEQGGIIVTWRDGGESVSAEFAASGGASWAGSIAGSRRPFGYGYPDASVWGCMRSNVGAKAPT